jgi:hypothetical protein
LTLETFFRKGKTMITRTNSVFFIAAVLAVVALPGLAIGFSGSGSGTDSDPYMITTVEQLQEMEDDLDASYVLGNDIDASATASWNSGAGFVPVGNATNPFTGKFDGRMFTITGLYINRPTTDLVGLFGSITEGAVVQSVGLAEVDITGRINSGPLVGASNGSTVCYCWSSGNIRGSHNYQMRLGGLIGISSGANSYVYECFSSVNVTATGGAHQVGGLAGYNGHGSIMSDCYATGDVSGYLKVGGLVGDNPYPEGGYITRCYSTGRVSGNGGGLVGYNFLGGVTYDSYWDRETSGKTTSRGGSPRSSEQMMQQATFVNWDFVDVWDIVEGETYPFLRCSSTQSMEVAVDIKPGSCPNPLNFKSRGILPVAILGNEDFDVEMIDIASVRLDGVTAVRSNIEDVAGPVVDGNECDCSEAGSDGYADLTLKFKTQDIAEALSLITDDLEKDDVLSLELTGSLVDGTPIEGSDCIVIAGKIPDWILSKQADLNEDGLVNGVDFSMMARYWLESSL